MKTIYSQFAIYRPFSVIWNRPSRKISFKARNCFTKILILAVQFSTKLILVFGIWYLQRPTASVRVKANFLKNNYCFEKLFLLKDRFPIFGTLLRYTRFKHIIPTFIVGQNSRKIPEYDKLKVNGILRDHPPAWEFNRPRLVISVNS